MIRRTMLAVAATVLLFSCGGGSGDGGGSTPTIQPPKALSYTTSTAVYSECVAITTNSPSSSGGAVISYHVNPALPTGLSLNTSTGVLSGTPMIATAAASYTVTASNSAGSTTATLTITVNVNATTPVVRVETPVQIAANMNPGWNLGNSLEATPTETSWNNPAVTGETFDDVKSIGYKSVRIPVYYGPAAHMGSAPAYVIDSTWLQRVSDAVDMALARDLYVVINIHNYYDLCTGFANDPSGNISKISLLWKQIAIKVRDKSPKVIFEVINEPGDQWGDQANNLTTDQLNQLNDAVVTVIRNTGGINANRCVLLPMRYTDTYQAANLVLPVDSNLIVTFHWYTPWTFTIGNNGVFDQTWGTAADLSELDTQFKAVKTIFTDNGIPVIVGEFGCALTQNPPYYVWYWTDSVVQKAQECGFAAMLWDNGELLNRSTHVWADPVRAWIQVQAAAGNKNSLVDTGALLEKTAAGIWVIPVSTSDLVLPLVLNGNTLVSVQNGTAALGASDYTVSGSTLTIKASYLATLPSGNASLRIGFSAGADTLITLSK